MSEMHTSERERVILAAMTGANANPNWLTCDMVDALLGGHGMLNIPVVCIANVIVAELLRGADIRMRFANAVHQPVDEVLAKSIKVAEQAGATPANAALLSAVMLYLAGTNAQVGIPAGNRKLGATARMIAGVDRCGVAMIPTAKKNNKVSGFPAVMAINQAMIEGRLSPISGHKVPVSGGPLVGHGRLGEDIIFPAMAENGARIGTQAMMDAMAGAGMKPHTFNAALFGAAAILEIIHPDADVADEYGPHGKVTTAYVAGKAAAETAKLPPTLHVRITGQEYSTAQLIGDLGLILKDIGGPTVIGIMALDEIMAVFQEGIAGSSAGPVNPPLGHVCADAVIGMKAMLEKGATVDSVGEALRKRRFEFSFDAETSMIAMNIIARKAIQVQGGPVTNAMIVASEPVRAKALYWRAARAYDDMKAGKSLQDVVRGFDEERKTNVEQKVSAFLSKISKKQVEVRLTHIGPGARRSSKLAKEWFAFDAHIDAEVTVDGNTVKLDHYSDQIIPDVALGKRDDIAWAVPMVAPLASEVLLAANVIINVTVPAAVAAAMGLMDAGEAGRVAQRAAFMTAGIPGANVHAELAAKLAQQVMAVP